MSDAPAEIGQPVPFEEWEAGILPRLTVPFRSRYGRLRWRDLDAPGPEYDYVIDELQSVNDKSIIGGPSGSGKSFLAVHAALSTAWACLDPSWRFFDLKILRPGLVVYQAGEGARGIKKRLRAWRDHFGVPRDCALPFELLQSRIDIYSPEGDTSGLIEEVLAIAKEHKAPLVTIYIDTLATAQGSAEENSGRDMGIVMGNIDRIRLATGAHVCLVHHLNAAGTKLRGHTSIFANIDQVIMVTCDDETRIRTARAGKVKDDADDWSVRFELFALEVGKRALDGKSITSCVCLPVGEKDAAKREAAIRRGFQLKPKEETLFRALMLARKAGRPSRPDDEGVPSDTIVVAYTEFREAFKSVAPPEEDGSAVSDESVRRHWERWANGLVKYGIIGWRRPLMWWTGRPVRGFPETFPPQRTNFPAPDRPAELSDENLSF